MSQRGRILLMTCGLLLSGVVGSVASGQLEGRGYTPPRSNRPGSYPVPYDPAARSRAPLDASPLDGRSPYDGSPYGGSPYDGSPYGGSPYGGSPFPDAAAQRGRPVGDPLRTSSVPVYRYYKYCTSCGETVPDDARIGDRCPECGVIWTADDSSPQGISTPAGSGSSGWNLPVRHQVQLTQLLIILVALAISGIGYFVRRAFCNPAEEIAAGRSLLYSPWELEQAGVRPPTSPSKGGVSAPGSLADPHGTHSITQLRKKLRPGE